MASPKPSESRPNPAAPAHARVLRRGACFSRALACLSLISALALCPGLPAQTFRLPTSNRALFERGGQERFYAPTPGKPWTSGAFGCVRTDGNQMHEGVDIRSVQHDRRGEPTDPVLATADGVVAYVNAKSGLSNFGKYIILKHQIEGMEIYSLYAHLSEIRPGLRPGLGVRAGEPVAVMGRSSNTRSAIGKDRAHVHFELDLLLNDRFAEWFKKSSPGERNDHGVWNGRNLVGLDPSVILRDAQAQAAAFSLRGFILSRPELCRVLVHKTAFPWLRRYAPLVLPNPRLGNQAPAGYELVLDYDGVPCQAIPRPASDFNGSAKYRLLSVNAAEHDRNHCRKLVARHGNTWQLTPQGVSLLDLLTY